MICGHCFLQHFESFIIFYLLFLSLLPEFGCQREGDPSRSIETDASGADEGERVEELESIVFHFLIKSSITTIFPSRPESSSSKSDYGVFSCAAMRSLVLPQQREEGESQRLLRCAVIICMCTPDIPGHRFFVLA